MKHNFLDSEQKKSWKNRVADLESISDITRKSRLIRLSNYVVGHNEILLKMESDQDIKSFKIRGAAFEMSTYNDHLKDRGVVANSGGNHAQAVAYASHKLDIPAIVLMDKSIPDGKVEATRRFGAKDGSFMLDTSSEDFAAAYQKALLIAGYDNDGNPPVDYENYPKYLSPYDDPAVVRGTATIATESLLQIHELGYKTPNSIHVPIGGGGLISGISDVSHELGHLYNVVGHNMQGSESGRLSMHSEKPIYIPHPNYLAEGIAVNAIGRECHRRMKQRMIDDVFTSTLADTGMAYRWYIDAVLPELGVDISNEQDVWDNLPELSSIVAISGLFKYLSEYRIQNQTHLVVVSGGNTNHLRTELALNAC